MYVSVNLKALDLHLALLQDELREVNILEDLLSSQYRLALEVSAEAAEMLKRQIQFVHDERERIRMRQTFLESAHEKFYAVHRFVSEQMEESVHASSALDAMY